jgi:N-acetylmuramoyl-L-alanine amidase
MKALAVALLFVSTETQAAYSLNKSEIDCISYAVYHEARGESVKGWAWVIDVIQNRSKSKLYPKNPCAVIKQRSQFSFWRAERAKIRNKKSRRLYSEISKLVRSGRWRGVSKGSMWYHAKYVKPRWRKSLIRVASVGEHVFYKERKFRT